jgi:hypothetical protein
MSRKAGFIAVALTMVSDGAGAADFKPQQQKPGWEFIIASGISAPTGAQEGVTKRGELTQAQLTYRVRPDIAVTGSFGWVRSRDIASPGAPKVDVFTYDAGAEYRGRPFQITGGTSFRPFIGTGIGARTYSYRNADLESATTPSGYLSAGGEIGYRRTRLRIEARDYISGFKPLGGKSSSGVGNDVAIMVGLRFVQR